MALAGRPRVLVRIRPPGRTRLKGRYTLVVLEHPGSDSDPPIGSDRRRGATYHAHYVTLWATGVERIVTSPPMAGIMDFHDPYME